MRFDSKKDINPKYLLLALTFVCMLLIVVSYFASSKVVVIKKYTQFVVAPISQGLDKIGTWTDSKVKNLKKIEELTVENEQLKEELAKAKSEATMYQNQITELANLQKLYEIDEIYEDYEKTAANVFAKDTTSWFSTFYIDKGTEDGVFEGANILCQDGLCGIVLESYDDYSKVRAIIDDNSKVSAKVLPSNALCTVDGNLSLYQNGYLIAKNIDKDAAIAVGDKIVTSQISDRFLPGITVGYIKEISLDSNNLTVTAYITPAADFDNISQVLIINEKKKTIIQEDK